VFEAQDKFGAFFVVKNYFPIVDVPFFDADAPSGRKFGDKANGGIDVQPAGFGRRSVTR
jgi:hypothetical protein